jgi:negative regulator of sigma E activity
METAAQTNHLTSTLQALTSTHADSLRQYTQKYHNSEQSRSSLSTQLEKAIREIKELNEYKTVVELELEDTKKSCKTLHLMLEDKKRNHLVQVDGLQRDIVSVREV